MAVASSDVASFAAAVNLAGLVLAGLATAAAVVAAAWGPWQPSPVQKTPSQAPKWSAFTSIRVAPQSVPAQAGDASGAVRRQDGAEGHASALAALKAHPPEGQGLQSPTASTPAGSGLLSATHGTSRSAQTLPMASSRELLPTLPKPAGLLRGQLSSELFASTGSGRLARRQSSRVASRAGRRQTAVTRARLVSGIGIVAGLFYTAAWLVAVLEPSQIAFHRVLWADAVLRGLAVRGFFLAAALFVATWHEGLTGQRSRKVLPCTWPVLSMVLPVALAALVAVVAGVVAITPGWGSGDELKIRNMVERVLLAGRVFPALLSVVLPIWKGIPVARKLSKSTLPAVKRVGSSTVRQ